MSLPVAPQKRTGNRRLRVAAVVLLLLAGTAPIVAQSDDTAEPGLEGEIEALAEVLLEADLSSADRIYVAAVILQKQGRHDEAIPVLRKLVSFNRDVLTYRRSLLDSLIAKELYESAEFQLEELSRIDPENRLAYNRMKDLIWQLKPTRLKFNLSFGPSNNLNKATSNTEAPDIGGIGGQINTTEQGGMFLDTGVTVEHRIPLGNGFRLGFSGALQARFHSLPDTDWGTGGAAVSLERNLAETSLKVIPSVSYNKYRNEINNSLVYGGSFTFTRQIAQPLLLEATAAVFAIDYESDINSFLDGEAYSAAAGFRYSLSASTSVSGNLQLKRNLTESDAFSYNSVLTGVGVSRAFENGVSLQLYGTFEERGYDAEFSPLLPLVREDRTLTAGISVSSSAIVIFDSVPEVSCLFQSTTSNIVFFDNVDIRECELAFTRRF